MKRIKTLREEIVPLSGKQALILYIIIACIFQFVLFYAPVLADKAVKQAKAAQNEVQLAHNEETALITTDIDLIINDTITKETEMNQQITATSTEIVYYGPKNTTKNIKPEKEELGVTVVRTSTHTMTAYNSDPRQTDNTPCITANGFNVCDHNTEDTIAANFLKFGTKVMIPDLFGDRVFIVRDRMNKRYSDRVDIWMKDYDDAIKFGVKVAKIQVIE